MTWSFLSLCSIRNQINDKLSVLNVPRKKALTVRVRVPGPGSSGRSVRGGRGCPSRMQLVPAGSNRLWQGMTEPQLGLPQPDTAGSSQTQPDTTSSSQAQPVPAGSSCHRAHRKDSACKEGQKLCTNGGEENLCEINLQKRPKATPWAWRWEQRGGGAPSTKAEIPQQPEERTVLDTAAMHPQIGKSAKKGYSLWKDTSGEMCAEEQQRGRRLGWQRPRSQV